LEGGQSGEEGAPPAPSLVAFAKQHTEADFIKTIRTGVTPEGRTLSEYMPWKTYQKFSDDDLRACICTSYNAAEGGCINGRGR